MYTCISLPAKAPTPAKISCPGCRQQARMLITDHRRCVSRGFSACVSLSRGANIPTELISVLVKQKGQ